MKKLLMVIYALGAYAVAMLNLAYIIALLGDFIVPKTINGGMAGFEGWLTAHFDAVDPLQFAVIVNTGLVLLFGFQHSITARRWFKAVWTWIVPPPLNAPPIFI